MRITLAEQGLSHWIGNPRVDDIDEQWDRWMPVAERETPEQ